GYAIGEWASAWDGAGGAGLVLLRDVGAAGEADDGRGAEPTAGGERPDRTGRGDHARGAGTHPARTAAGTPVGLAAGGRLRPGRCGDRAGHVLRRGGKDSDRRGDAA